LADTSTRGAAGAGTVQAADTQESTRADTLSNRVLWLAEAPRRLAGTARTHWQFSIVLLAAVLLRIVVILGYPPIMWFNDSFNYFQDAITHVPDYVRPNGYPFFLNVLLPFHNLYLVSIAQAALGAGMGVLIYALLRRRGLPWWGATLLALPVMFDVFEMQIEHMITADTLFTFLVTLALVVCCWNDRPSIPVLAIAGLLIGYATLVRSVGQPLLVVFAIGMLARRAGWKQLTAMVVAGIVPIGLYMVWFHHTSGKFALSEGGAFLYSRVSTFAECSKMPSLPANLKVLCDRTPPQYRPSSQEYVWSESEAGRYANRTTPLYNLVFTNNADRFTPELSGMAQKFAEVAILSQPMDYIRVVTKDVVHTFGWFRQADPQNIYGNGSTFRFDNNPAALPWWASDQYPGDKGAVTLNNQLKQYFGPGLGQQSVAQPWAGWMQQYENVVYLPGTLLGLLLFAGAAGVVLRWRRWGSIGLLPLLIGVLLIVIPPMTAGFSYRYILAAVPAVCLAAGLAFARLPGDTGSVRARAADLRRNLGGRVPVEQE
jgi:hypothetical protein